ncbi:hypothetical protein DPEC_G00199290 [Dallia pectoralis]|uniref:Uncharacterized protein n=1 Tax=Dallia pectoralis TaxID=75939 RepID=A0ACC2G830_DALPE|nr:hypothetical protein DPEC_G00199290 [Dallia pectoralis]
MAGLSRSDARDRLRHASARDGRRRHASARDGRYACARDGRYACARDGLSYACARDGLSYACARDGLSYACARDGLSYACARDGLSYACARDGLSYACARDGLSYACARDGLSYACARDGLSYACARDGLSYACARDGFSYACARDGLSYACTRDGLSYACARDGLSYACARDGLSYSDAPDGRSNAPDGRSNAPDGRSDAPDGRSDADAPPSSTWPPGVFPSPADREPRRAAPPPSMTRVWTEPCLLQAAKDEYDEIIEEFLVVGEKLFGPYVWGRYDVLTFPFGGMENPCLTFVTPCLLAGDRSLTDVIVHEICHSWFGNLVTNANWSDFWLNEGFTMFAQRMVCREIYGEAYTCLEAATGRALLRRHMDNTGEDHPLNKLRVKIKPGVDPDDTYNDTPYDKGFCFVSYLAHLVGDKSRFDGFLKVLEFDSWLNVSGWPPYLPDLSAGQSLMKPAEELSDLWAAEVMDMISIKNVNTQAWKTYQTAYFLEKIIERPPLPRGNIEKLEEHYPHIVKSNNAELRLRWAQIIAKNQHQPGYQHVRSFLSCQGKQKYTLPMYLALWNGSEETRALATDVFNATCQQLHVNVSKNVKKIIN